MMLRDALEMVVRTDPGLIRSHNEDAVFAEAGLGIAILADGMGGYNAGEVASGMAITRLADDLNRVISSCVTQEGSGSCDPSVIERHIVNEVGAANFAIFHASQSCSQYAGMGTTLVLAWFYDNRMSVAHVGDSRLYRLRGQVFELLTRDHSLRQEQVDNGMISPEEARYAENRNLVTRALGVDPSVDVEVHDFDVQPGDIVLLCSDGLNDMLEDEDIALTLSALGGNLPLAADHLIQLANDHGGRDNVSVILVKVLGDYSAPKGWWQRLFGCLK
ncbi:MAG: Protein phosphatase 2C-like protein [Proteobacteria bacterium]|nr:Protein phosphatase 2C-like protein [Pseudomonadota bacterium]